ncbi:RluA family pseudouridine synthase [Candidatus Enterococcus willemsii]|uniref:Pseudouridine synthase n=1 Tax=Candidatus Enterococcus willemsii TaxID=1857215 RepID=A0ABQ6YWM3_9ENTE|nr:RluA family pseudouridine synthase [Enterococcus sp. CU12B]KAF1302104.1 RNA pseudouridine synthase [Enterococcus sp. CU12B]
MKFMYTYQKDEPQQLKFFLKEQGISKGLLAKIKFQGGHLFVNGCEQNVLYLLTLGDQICVVTPDEAEHETLLLDETPIEIVFEDEHLLLVNKPAGVSSIPAQYHPNNTMANRVKAYYKRRGYADQVVHVVTRLDRDTSGLMLFAKHGFAHAKLDVQLRKKEIIKKYQALLCGNIAELQEHGRIELPIGRDLTSIIKRQVTEDGRFAETEYWLSAKNDTLAFVDIQLHTGRTHQIRVHFSAIGCPLVGDDMYGGTMALSLVRQALHCRHLQFRHPFTNEQLVFDCPLPEDMKAIKETIDVR